MTPEKILRDLRDVHLPEPMAETASAGIILWPVALVMILALLAILLIRWRASAWRRDALLHLEAIERGIGEGHILEGWAALALLLRRLAIQAGDREDDAGLIGDAWLARLDRLFKTKVFSDGPGRGLSLYPFKGAFDDDGSEREAVARQLQATVDAVRSHLPRLRGVGAWN